MATSTVAQLTHPQGDIGLPGVSLYRGWLDLNAQRVLLRSIRRRIEQAPLFQPTMPRTGRPLSVKMTNCGTLGWVSDKTGGYRYQAQHPETGQPWPTMPRILTRAWRELAGYDHPAEACLINYYGRGARMGGHVDRDEDDLSAPVLSVSLGDTAIFHVGGLRRNDPKTRFELRSGDVLVLGGPARLSYHGVDRILPMTSDLLSEGGRFNVTLRRVTLPTP